jgi:arylsulfatase
MLLQHGYNTYALGKWHLTPADQLSAAGPYDRWPLGRGFERFYGFLGGETHQYYPELVSDNHTVEAEKSPEEGYHLTEDLVDKAISFIADAKQVAPNKPFFMYFCPGTAHAPHHVPKEWADKYKGKFDDGWDKLRERTIARQKELGIVPADAQLSRHDPDVPEWEPLSAAEKKLYARMMEVFAGFLTHADHHIGRLIEFLKNLGELDNTLIMAISDNGASSEGGPSGMVNEALSTTCKDRSKRTWPLWTSLAVRKSVTTTPGAGRGRATRRSAVGSAKPIAAVSAIHSSFTGRKASKRKEKFARTTRMP